MKIRLLSVILFIFTFSTSIVGQVKIGDDPNQIDDNSSLLELQSTTKTLVLTRVTETQMQAIVTPLPGSLVYNTTENCVFQYNGTWVTLCNTSTGGGPDMIGITDLEINDSCTALNFTDQNGVPQNIDLQCAVKNNETLTSIRIGTNPGEIIYTDETGSDNSIIITGITGPVGPAGPAGRRGPAGPQGNIGPAGPIGIQGIPGPQGLQGRRGPAGNFFDFRYLYLFFI